MANLIGFVRVDNFHVLFVVIPVWCCFFVLLFRNYYPLTDLGITSKETSNRTNIEARVACSIESAALHHSGHDVILRSIGAFSPTDPYITVLRGLANFRFLPLNPDDHFKGTPFEEWYGLGLIQQSKWPVNQLSNALRLAILWREGGVYLDTDIIVLRPFGGLRNAVALQSPRTANNAILFFDRSSRFLLQCMEDFIEEFRGDVWGHQGPQLITRNIKEFCKWKSLEKAMNERSVCEGVTLLTPASFYPISHFKLFAQVNDVDLSTSYAVHLWAKISKTFVAAPGTNSLIEYLARNNCPLVYEIIKKNKAI